MKKRTLGKSGFQVSEIGLGCWQLGGDFGPINGKRSHDILSAAVESGINFLDTADVYGGGKSETRIEQFRFENKPQVIVATKVGRGGTLFPEGYTKEKVRSNIAGSAIRLGVETVDLVQLHCIPVDVLKDGSIFTWLEDFKKQGLIRAFGASVETLEEARLIVDHPGLASLQIIFNLFRQNAIMDLFPAAIANNVGIIVRLPLASGVLSGNMLPDQVFDPSDHRSYNRHGEAFSQGETFSGIPYSRALKLVEEMRPWVPEGMSMAQMAMRWILDQPAVSTVIAGATRPRQARENAATSDLPPLSPELHQKLTDFYQQKVAKEIVVPV
jgi:aryl-alcohol dehydrogenase-like predicted oxidoreductase